MKLNEKDKKKRLKLKDKIVKTKKEQVVVVAQEIKFARLLSGNENKTRERVLKALKKWLQKCFQRDYEFKEDDFVRVWKGIFYAMWMSDKPLVQEDLSENIAGVLDEFPPENLRHALLMTKAGFKVLATEWFGIDSHRMDKFLMLARRYLRGSLRCLLRCEWSVDSCREYAQMLSDSDGLLCVKTPYYARNAKSLLIHFVDCFLEELAKVSKGKISKDSMTELLRPFCEYSSLGDSTFVMVACNRLLDQLLRQSDEGIMYAEATRAWKKMKCPKGGPDALELVMEDGDDETDGDDSGDDETGALDPRAGRVDVILDSVPVPGEGLSQIFRGLLDQTSSKAHNRTRRCMNKFEQYSKGSYPLKLSHRDTNIPRPNPSLGVKQAVRRLQDIENNGELGDDDIVLRGLSRKHRKRLLAKSRAGISIVEELENINKSNDKKNGKRKLEPPQAPPKKIKLENGLNNKKDKQTDKPTQPQKQNKLKKLKENITPKITHKETSPKTEEKVTKPSIKTVKNPSIKTDKKTVKNPSMKTVKTPSIKTVKPSINTIKPSTKTVKKDKPTVLANKVKKFMKINEAVHSPKKVKFVLKNNCMQKPVDYYLSVRKSPSIPFDGSKRPVRTNLKPSTPSPINPFFKKKLRLK